MKELEWRHMGEERASDHGSFRSLDEGKKAVTHMKEEERKWVLEQEQSLEKECTCDS